LSRTVYFLRLQVPCSASVKNIWQMQVIQVLFQEKWWEGGMVACLIFNQWPCCTNRSYPTQHVCVEINKILPFHITKSINYYLLQNKIICGNQCIDMQINLFMFKLHADSTDFILHQGGLLCHIHLEVS
jgi:hypothetical protein